MADVRARLAMARDILTVRKGLSRVAAGDRTDSKYDERNRVAKATAARRITAIRKALLGRHGAGLADDLMAPGVGYQRLLDIRNGAEPADVAATATYVGALFESLREIERLEKRAGLRDDVTKDDTTRALDLDRYSGHDMGPLIDSKIAQGMPSQAIRDSLAEAMKQPKPHELRIEDVAPELADAYKAAEKAYSHFSDKVEKSRKDFYDAERDHFEGAVRGDQESELKRLEERKKLLENVFESNKGERRRAMEFMGELCEKVNDKLKTASESLNTPFRDAGQSVIDEIKQASPVTQAQAVAWAKAIVITKAAAARMSKQGYKPDMVRSDIAEFYQLTGGRINPVKIDSKGDRRANAGGIQSESADGVVYVDGGFNKRVLWHELAHHLEADPVAGKAARAFIIRRSEDGVNTHRLKDISGIPSYKDNEVAYKDSFFDPYVGKDYGDYGITEVFSMGIESFSDPLLLGRRMAQDHETLAFVTGFVKGPPPELAVALQSLRMDNGGTLSGIREEAQSSVADLIKQIAARVEIIPDTDTSWAVKKRSNGYGSEIGTVDYYDRVLRIVGATQQIGRIIVPGTNESLYAFSGKIKNDKKRKVNGLFVVRDGNGQPHWYPIDTTDQDVLKAAALIYSKEGTVYSSNMNNETFLRAYL